MRTRNSELKSISVESKENEIEALSTKEVNCTKLRKKSGYSKPVESGAINNDTISGNKDPSFSFDKLMKSIVNAFQDKSNNKPDIVDEIEVVDANNNHITFNGKGKDTKEKDVSAVNGVNHETQAKNINRNKKSLLSKGKDDLIEILDDDPKDSDENHFSTLKYKR